MTDAEFANKMAADNAEYAFRLYCESVPGVKAADILDNLSNRPRNESFWKMAMKRAEIASYKWLQA